jgi:hypothetical protein
MRSAPIHPSHRLSLTARVLGPYDRADDASRGDSASSSRPLFQLGTKSRPRREWKVRVPQRTVESRGMLLREPACSSLPVEALTSHRARRDPCSGSQGLGAVQWRQSNECRLTRTDTVGVCQSVEKRRQRRCECALLGQHGRHGRRWWGSHIG